MRHPFPERVLEALFAPLISALGELTEADILGVTQLSYTNQVSHPKQGEKGCILGGKLVPEDRTERRE